MSERRVGRRAEQKRLADEKLKHPCADCGETIGRKETRCRECENARRRAQPYPRAQEIVQMWNEGRSLNEIAAALGCTRGSVSGTVARLRDRGYDLPRRYQ